MTQRERIASGKLFTDMGEGLPEERLRGKERMHAFNQTRPTEIEKRFELMKEMFGAVGEHCWIEPPIYQGRARKPLTSVKGMKRRPFAY